MKRKNFLQIENCWVLNDKDFLTLLPLLLPTPWQMQHTSYIPVQMRLHWKPKTTPHVKIFWQTSTIKHVKIKIQKYSLYNIYIIYKDHQSSQIRVILYVRDWRPVQDIVMVLQVLYRHPKQHICYCRALSWILVMWCMLWLEKVQCTL